MRGPQRSGVGAVVLCLLCARLAAGSDDLFGVDYKRDNLIRNGDFELSLSRMTALFWQPFVFDFPYVTSRRSHGGIRSAMLSVANHSDSSNDAWRGIGQYIYVNQTVVVDLEISAWASGFALSEPARVFCDLKYSDKTWDLDKTLVFPAGRFQWERRSIMLSPAKPVEAAFVYLVLFGEAGSTAFFDDLALVERPDLPLPAPAAEITEMSARGALRPASAMPSSFEHTGHCPEGGLRVMPNVLAPSDPVRNDDVTIVTQLSPDRFDRVQLLAERFDGPISAAVYVRRVTEELVSLVQQWNGRQSAAARKRTSVHLVSPCNQDAEVAAQRDYPINFLRNVAWHHARTTPLLLLDVDFMPSANLHSDLRSMWRRFHRVRGLQRAAFVVPAFEMRGASRKWPGDKEELVELVEGGQALPVHEEKLAAAHGATDYSRWYMAANAYEVRYQLQYEPYVMVHRDAPRYDDKFVGYGQDKVSHVYELHLAGYRFVVLPHVFAIHMEHPVPKWRAAQNVTRVWVNWYAFIYDREREHGGGIFSPNSGGVSGGQGSASPFCSDTCQYAKDGACDDGGPGADYSGCSLGTDCTDCGDRTPAEWRSALRLQDERAVRRAKQQRVLARRRALAAAGIRSGGGEDETGDGGRSALTEDAAAKLQENAEFASRTAAECQEALEEERAAGRQLQRRSNELESTVRQLEARVDRAVRERNTAASTLAQVQDALVRAEDMF